MLCNKEEFQIELSCKIALWQIFVGHRSAWFPLLSQAAQTLLVIYTRDSIALRFEPFKRMYENGSKIALNSTCSKGFK